MEPERIKPTQQAIEEHDNQQARDCFCHFATMTSPDMTTESTRTRAAPASLNRNPRDAHGILNSWPADGPLPFDYLKR